MGIRRTTLTSVALLVLAVALTGCAGDSGPFEAGESATLPPPVDTDGLIAGTSRHLGEGPDGTEYYVAQWDDDAGTLYCVLAYPDEDGAPAQMCGTSLPVEGGFQNTRVLLSSELVADDEPGATVIGSYLQVTQE